MARAIFALLATALLISCEPADPAPAQPCSDPATSRSIRELALEAVDRSFQAHVSRLFESWMREETSDQRERIRKGMEKATRAYLASRQAIEAWKGECR